MRAVVVLVLLAGAAYAQPPGQTQPVAPGSQPPASGPIPAQPSGPSVMDRRWSVALSVGPLGLDPKDSETDNVTFGHAELAGHYRVVPEVDLGLSIYGGGSKGKLGTSGIYIDGRYRFLAGRPLNIYVLVSLGVVSVADDNATDEAKKARGSLRLGAGVDRRFGRFSLHAELRFIGVGENKDFTPAAMTVSDELAKHELSGGSFVFGGTVYF